VTLDPPLLPLSPLTREAYAPYGDVIMASPSGEEGRPANQGTARRFDHLAALENLRVGTAQLNVSAFRCAPRPPGRFTIELLEKHPRSTQIFVPMCAERFVAVVALGGGRPDPSTLAAFVATGAQGVTYRPGVWHHPMIALDATTDFACFVHEDGTEDDCVLVTLDEAERRAIVLG
jgi:ureidoglycolate lyase